MLSYIEERRMRNRKGDVNLMLDLNVSILESHVVVSRIHAVDPKYFGVSGVRIPSRRGEVSGYVMVYVPVPPSEYAPMHSDLYILSGKDSPIFLAAKRISRTVSISIPASDWIHDFAPKLGLGEYFIVEIPKGEETIKDAWEYVRKAEESFRTWNTKGVFASCREVLSLLDRKLKEEFGEESFVYRERWGRVYKRFKELSSLDLHIEDLKKAILRRP